MKKLLSIAILSLFLNSCDDGDIVYNEPNFDNTPVQICEDKGLYYKINGKNMLILKDNQKIITEANFELGQFKDYPIGVSLELISRTYDDVVTSISICNTLPPVRPMVVKEMLANEGGTVRITRDFRTINQNELNTPVTINYYYNYQFLNFTFQDGDETLKQTNLNFGEFIYKTNFLKFPFTATSKLLWCSQANKDRLVINDDYEALVLIPPVGALENTEKNISLNLSDTNSLTYKAYRIDGGAITFENACSDETELEETIQIENWIATAGTLKIVTTKVEQPENSPEQKTEFLHKLSFENVTFTKEGRSFVKEVFNFGEITTEVQN